MLYGDEKEHILDKREGWNAPNTTPGMS